MEIKDLILHILKEKRREVKASDIKKITGFSRAYINRFFQELRNEGKILLLGKANRARYVLATKGSLCSAKKTMLRFHRILHNKGLSEDAVLDEIKKETGIFIGIPQNVSRILDYAFTEMLNNAIEHSQTRKIEIFMKREKEIVRFDVVDKGIGIFNNIMQKRHFRSHMEAIQDLLKGKLSTAPERHSGEGIFFTSKTADAFVIQSSQKKLIFNNVLNDTFINDIKNYIGTKIVFTISTDSKRSLRTIFKAYTGDLFEFSKTKVNVKLYKAGTEYISRSQARRILSGLEEFKTVILDFKGVKTIGQGFADEVFRVWKLRYPKSVIIPQSANENIQFMINRASQCK